MGYLTNYEVQATGFETTEEVEFFEFKLLKESGYSFESGSVSRLDYIGSLQDAKWYNYDENLIKLSKDFPYITIDVEGRGEDEGDYWRARYRNGESENVRAVISFPNFKKLT